MKNNNINTKLAPKTQNNNTFIKASYLIFIIPFVLTIVIGWFLAHYGPLPHHEGTILYPAHLINKGLVPIKEVMMQQPPMTSYLYAMFFRLFGEYFLVARIATLLCSSLVMLLSSVIIFKITKNKLISILSVIVYIFYSNFIHHWNMKPWSSLWGLLIMCIITLLMFKYIENNKYKYLLFSGLFCGLLTSFRLNLGAYSAVCIVFFLVLEQLDQNNKMFSFKNLLLNGIVFSIGFFVTFLTFLLFLYYKFQSIEPFLYFLKFQSNLLKSMEWISTFRNNNFAVMHEDLGLSINGLKFSVYYLLVFVLLSYLSVKYFSKVVLGIFILFLTLVISYIFFKTGNDSIFQLFFDCGPIVIAVCIFDFFYLKKYAKIDFNKKYLFLGIFSIAGWGLMYPGGGTDVIYLAYGGLFPYLTISTRLGLTLDKLGDFKSKNLIFTFVFISLLISLFNPREILSKKYFFENGKLVKTKSDFSKGLCVYDSGFYKGTIAINCGVMIDHQFIKQYLDKELLPNDSYFIWKGQVLHYVYFDKPNAVLPFSSLDLTIYTMKEGNEIDESIVNKLKFLKPRCVVIDSYGQKYGDEVPETYYNNMFPKVEKYIIENYKDTIVAPYKNYLILYQKQKL